MLRVYVIHLMVAGWYEVKQVGVKVWTMIYMMGAGMYVWYASVSTLGVDAANPLRIVALLGFAAVVNILVRALHKKNKET